MNYTYAYKTSDGKRHEAAMDAESREAVFEALRARGIRAIKVVAADGSKANGAPRRVPRLTSLVPVVAAAVVLASLASLVSLKSFLSKGDGPTGPATATPRHQIYGDPATMEAFGRGEFGDALPREGDRLLAVFAQPGRLMCERGFNPQMPSAAQLAAFSKYAKDELVPKHDLPVDASSPREERELRQIVNGMRAEMREYLANGNGTPRSYWRRLGERTMQEMQIFERTRRELDGEKSDAVWEAKNDALRRIGLRTILHSGDSE